MTSPGGSGGADPAMREDAHVHPPFLDIDGLANFRDLGGLPTPAGPVRSGVLFRSDGLHQLSDAGRAAVLALGCATIIDLRTTEELERLAGPFPAVHVPLHEELDDLGIADPLALVGLDEGVAWLTSLYTLLLEHAGPQFRTIFETLADDANLPAIVHCAGGKDRTGLTVALILSILGVPRDVVLDDFALQSPHEEWQRRRDLVKADFVRMGIDGGAASALVVAPRTAMHDTLAHLDDAYGGAEAYLCDTCGIARSALGAVRRHLVGGGAPSR